MYQRKHIDYPIILLVCFFYFEVGFIVSLTAVLLPELITAFSLSSGTAAMLPFAYYISFAVFALPAGIATDRYTYKKLLIVSFCFGLLGAVLFLVRQNFHGVVLSLFIIGCSLTFVQVLSVPLLRQACGPKRLPFYSTFTMLLYGVGAFVSPIVNSYMIELHSRPVQGIFLQNVFHYIIGSGQQWAAIYLVVCVMYFLTILVVVRCRFPNNALIEEERINTSSLNFKLIGDKKLFVLFLALVAYSCCEQGVSNWLIRFFQIYHPDIPIQPSLVLSYYWILLSVGCIFGMGLLKKFHLLSVLKFFVAGALVSIVIGLYASTYWSIAGFLLTGLFHSIMWPVIISLAINLYDKNHGTITGLMFIGSVGGAFGPMIIGQLADLWGLKPAFSFLGVCYLFILLVSFGDYSIKTANCNSVVLNSKKGAIL